MMNILKLTEEFQPTFYDLAECNTTICLKKNFICYHEAIYNCLHATMLWKSYLFNQKFMKTFGLPVQCIYLV